jgi:hypothetical protein
MKKYLIIFCFLSIIFIGFSSNTVMAKCTLGIACNEIQNPLAVDTPQALIGIIINYVLGVVGSIALLMFVYGGLTWMTSSGNQESVKKGREIIIWSAIGLAIIFTSYGLVRVLLSSVI